MMKAEQSGICSGFTGITPVMELTGSHPGHNRIFMKRDDLLPYGLGGNKVRIALEFMKDMEAEGADAMILYGDLRSNLCRVLALMCARKGVPAVMAATDAAEADESGSSFNERMIRACGVRILPTAKDGIADAVDRAFQLLKGEGRKPYYIYGSRLGRGRENVPVRAYRDAFGEIASQCEAAGRRIDLLASPCGTGATLAGLAVGRAGQLVRGGFLKDTRILGLSISSREEKRASEAVQASVGAGLLEAGLPGLIHFPELYELTCDYNGGGYGLAGEEIRSCMRDLWLSYGIPSDPTYTAKAFRGLLAYIADRNLSGQNILFLHTGGTPLFYDEWQKGAFTWNRN